MYIRLVSPIAIDTTTIVACPTGDTGIPPNCQAPSPCSHGSIAFLYNGSSQDWQPTNLSPSCKVTITIAAADGGGQLGWWGGRCSNGEYGSEYTLSMSAQALIQAMQGLPMYIFVGQEGGTGSSTLIYGGGGYGGGEKYGHHYYAIGGEGGGASWIQINGSTVAGAGGGGGGGGYCGESGLNGGGGPYGATLSTCTKNKVGDYVWDQCSGGSGGQSAGGGGGICPISAGECNVGDSGTKGTATQGGNGGSGGQSDYGSGYCTNAGGGGGGGGGGSVFRAGGGGGGGNTLFHFSCIFGGGGGGGGGANFVSSSLGWSKGSDIYNTKGNGFVDISWE